MSAIVPKYPKLADLSPLSDPDKVLAIQRYVSASHDSALLLSFGRGRDGHFLNIL